MRLECLRAYRIGQFHDDRLTGQAAALAQRVPRLNHEVRTRT